MRLFAGDDWAEDHHDVEVMDEAGYLVFPVNPLQAARFRQRHGVSGAKSDAGDAHALADMARTDSHQLRLAAGDSPEAGGSRCWPAPARR